MDVLAEVPMVASESCGCGLVLAIVMEVPALQFRRLIKDLKVDISCSLSSTLAFNVERLNTR